MANPKSLLHEWCAKNKVFPQFVITETDSKHSKNYLRFKCEVTVPGYNGIGVGYSTRKKDSQRNASQDFLSILMYQGLIASDSLDSKPKGKTAQSVMTNMSPKPINQQNEIHSMVDEAYQPIEQKEFSNEIKVETVENVDANAAIYGNWTIDNAKLRLNQFIQSNDLESIKYEYSFMDMSYTAETSLYVNKLNKTITARESGSNKQLASQKCALSLVHQLYHLNVIEPFSRSLKREKSTSNLESRFYEVNVDPLLLNKVNIVLEEFNIKPVIQDDTVVDSETTSLISNQVLAKLDESKSSRLPRVIPWSPVQLDWNPWLGIKIETDASLNEISEQLIENYNTKLSEDYEKLLESRDELPAFAKKQEILKGIKENSIIIIQGSTGCGKTTQICQFILDEYLENGKGAYCNIVCTQQRKISAISVAHRVAFERYESIGSSVGYSVNFDSIFPQPHGAILFCTVDVLLRNLENGMHGISHIIVDDIHERDAYSDFLMIVLKDMVYNYPELRVIFMSTTIETGKTDMFSNYLNCCPVIDIEGRCYPVEEYFLEDIVDMLNYLPVRDIKKFKTHDEIGESVTEKQDSEDNCNLILPDTYSEITRTRVALISENDVDFKLIEALLAHINLHMWCSSEPGAVLIILPTWTIIFAFQRYLLNKPFLGSPKFSILPFHTHLPYADQQRVFESVPFGVQKVILSTNTSLTIKDVVFVINTCKLKKKLFSNHNHTTHYTTVWASKTNMLQRKSQAGRFKQGYCFNLCTKARYQKMDEYIIPEIFRTCLTELVLFIKLLKLGDIGHFFSKAIAPPPINAVIEAQVMLKEMKCLDVNEELTPLGRILAKLPLEPQIGRMMVLGNILLLGDSLSIIAATCSNITDIFVLGHRMRQSKRYFSGNRCSDHLIILNAFNQWSHLFSHALRLEDFYTNYMLSESSLVTIADNAERIKDLFLNFGFPQECFQKQNFHFGKKRIYDEPMLDMISAFLTIGFYPNVCYHQDKVKVVTAEGKAVIKKTSVNFSNNTRSFQSPFFVFKEKVHNTAVVCKQMSMVTPIHLLLFGARKIECTNDKVLLDNWINLKMDAKAASAIVALRPAIENLIVRVSESPGQISKLNDADIKLVDVLKELCNFNAGRYNLFPISFDVKQLGYKRMYHVHDSFPGKNGSSNFKIPKREF